MKHRTTLLASLSLLACSELQAQVMQRELGSYDLQLGTSPVRSMAQGLVKPAKNGSFHGGFDLANERGWYLGSWSPSMGLGDSQAEFNTYSGFKRPLGKRFGYELGLIRYTYPELRQNDSNEYYAGLSLLGSRFGAAFSNAPGRTDSTLLMDLSLPQPLELGLTVKYATHLLDTPVNLSDGGSVRSFNDWSFNLSRPWAGVDLNLSYTSSNLGGVECAAYSGHNSYCENYLMLKAERQLF
ncbi:TorF family putative porin [Pseudomonas sp. LRF_L74]|uniref:TorF family putative porin n=1 Tax=Pseudomonas sp. LRF_L74 TaxID=3369422 RepID=UPI003F6098D3